MATKLTREQRREIAALVLTGARNPEVAEKYGVSHEYVSRLRSKMRAVAPASFDYRAERERLRVKAYGAVQTGLDDNTDSYKKAGIGIQVLKGTGDLTPDTTMQISIQTMLAAVPPEWRERYTMTPVTDENPPR